MALACSPENKPEKFRLAAILQLGITAFAPGRYLLVIKDGGSRYASGFTRR